MYKKTHSIPTFMHDGSYNCGHTLEVYSSTKNNEKSLYTGASENTLPKDVIRLQSFRNSYSSNTKLLKQKIKTYKSSSEN